MGYTRFLTVHATGQENIRPRAARQPVGDRPFLRSFTGEQKVFSCLALTLLPWLAVIAVTARLWGLLNFVGYILLVTAVGYELICLVLPCDRRSHMLVLSPALGIVEVSSLSALWLRLRLPLAGCAGIWLVLFAAGVFAVWKDRSRWQNGTIAFGRTLAVLSLLVCFLFFLPAARNDAVRRSNGSFNWMYVDTQHFYALSESVAQDNRPPRTPGTATAELLYHFGPYVPAAILSHLDGLDLGDALARVTHGASIWALMLSAFSVGTLLAIRTTRARYAGIATVAGLFFYGSPLALFADEWNVSSHVTGAILYTIPYIAVPADGGPFSHVILGHSVLHGMLGISAVMALCLGLACDESSKWRYIVLVALPSLVVPVNSVAALYCLGVVSILAFWGNMQRPWKWLAIALMFACFLIAWKIMGYSHAPDLGPLPFDPHPEWKWWTITSGFIVGLGFRIFAFTSIPFRRSQTVSVLFLATIIGFLCFNLLLKLRDGNEHYGSYYLQCMFSIFAFSQIDAGWWQRHERRTRVIMWTRLARKGTLICAVAGFAFGGYSFARYHHTGVDHFVLKIVATLLVAAALTGILIVLRSGRPIGSVASALVLLFLLAGFTAWIPAWLNFGMGRMKLDINIPSGVIQGLDRLRAISGPDERFATNKHDLAGDLVLEASSYAYAPLAQRPVLLEGYLCRGEDALPWFPVLLHDNDLMFTTSSPDQLRHLTAKWDVTWLVARPGSDISLFRPLPNWLTEENDTGTLRIYRVQALSPTENAKTK